MAVFIVLWSYLLTTKLRCLQKNNIGHSNEGENEESIVKVEDSFSNNPWCVDDASVFLKFCCPECDYQIPDLQMFHNHAIGNHTKGQLMSE